MIIGPNRYDDGELLAPRASELDKHPGLGGMPSTDAGYCHRFVYEAVNQKELDAKNARFFRIMGDVPGFSTLKLRPFEVRVGNYYRTGMDIVYTVETPFTGVR